MAKDDLALCDGKVIDHSAGGVYRVLLDSGVEVKARLCGKMKRFRIRVLVGDKVSVGLSPYDISHGLVMHRYRV